MTKYFVSFQLLVLLTVPKEAGQEKRPQLLIVEPKDDDYTEISTDLLSVRGFETYRPCDYHLEYLLEDQVRALKSVQELFVCYPQMITRTERWL